VRAWRPLPETELRPRPDERGGGKHESESVPHVREAPRRARGSHGVPERRGCDFSARRSLADVALVAAAARNGCAG